jgi:hypothetical protein
LLAKLRNPTGGLHAAAHVRIEYPEDELPIALGDGFDETVLEARPRRIARQFIDRQQLRFLGRGRH